MQTSAQTLATAIAGLRCVAPDRAASLEELHALSIAQRAIENLMRSCVEQLRSDSHRPQEWSAIAGALGESSASAVRRRFDQRVNDSRESIAAFWDIYEARFESDFLPIDFLHALYTAWIRRELPDRESVTQRVFSHRLKPIAALSDWTYARSRASAAVTPQEPLLSEIPHWAPSNGAVGIYGLRRAHH